jgi:hypothetical protein
MIFHFDRGCLYASSASTALAERLPGHTLRRADGPVLRQRADGVVLLTQAFAYAVPLVTINKQAGAPRTGVIKASTTLIVLGQEHFSIQARRSATKPP